MFTITLIRSYVVCSSIRSHPRSETPVSLTRPATLSMADTNQNAPAPTNAPANMYTAIKDWAQVQEEEYILEETVTLLAAAGLVAPWQLQEAPDAFLQVALPLETHGRHYLVAARTRTTLTRWDSSAPDAMAHAIENLANVTHKVPS